MTPATEWVVVLGPGGILPCNVIQRTGGHVRVRDQNGAIAWVPREWVRTGFGRKGEAVGAAMLMAAEMRGTK